MEDMPGFIKFDFEVDAMMGYCETCDRKECVFGYDNCPCD